MKNILYGAIIALLCLIACQTHAQAFAKGNVIISGGIGFNTDFAGRNTDYRSHSRVTLTTPVPQFNFKTEIAIHKYWGIGVLGSVSYGRSYSYDGHWGKTLTAEAGVYTNFHLYQLIADRTHSRRMHAEKWDIYIGMGLGYRYESYIPSSGPASSFNGAYAGAHIGVRYQINEHWSAFAEMGIGQATFNIGIAYKFNLPKKKKPIKTFDLSQ